MYVKNKSIPTGIGRTDKMFFIRMFCHVVSLRKVLTRDRSRGRSESDLTAEQGLDVSKRYAKMRVGIVNRSCDFGTRDYWYFCQIRLQYYSVTELWTIPKIPNYFVGPIVFRLPTRTGTYKSNDNTVTKYRRPVTDVFVW